MKKLLLISLVAAMAGLIGCVGSKRAASHKTYIAPELSGARSQVRGNVLVDPATALRNEQIRYDDLRTKREAGERALANEVDETKRAMLQRQVEQLREEVRLQEQRVRALERELK